jgi:uncharacterized protein YdeI (YjbR/CyaY-like superfamily)
MAKSRTNPKADGFFEKDTQWQKEYKALRTIALELGLTEEWKWYHPCYQHNGNNIVLIHGFKEYCAYLLFKGALLSDPKDILVQQTENVQAARQIRFTSVAQITKMKATLKAYIKEAIEAEEAGLKVTLKKTAEFPMAEEFRAKLNSVAGLEEAFYGLTPGRQRGYLLYFSSAKQSKTRQERVDKYLKQILKGKGLDD